MEKLYNKYRFKTFDGIIGDLPHIKKLKADVTSGNIDHAYLFYSDTQGTGKTSTARLVGANIPGVYIEEVNAAVTGGADKGREIAINAGSVPIGYKGKLIIINEPMRSTGNFFNALLEAVEETGDNLYFIITTTNVKKIPADIRSRFTDIKFTSPDTKSLRAHLTYICEQENINASRIVLTEICKKNNNIVRDSISDLELLVGIDDEVTQLELLSHTKGGTSSTGYKIAKALSGKSKWKTLSTLLKEVKQEDVEGVRRSILHHHTKELLDGNGASALIVDSFLKEMYDTPIASLVMACYDNVEE